MVSNAYIFVADALRWDYLPDSIRRMGTVAKTIAASTITPTSFSSICSGLNPPQHGVHTFYYQLDRKQNLLEIDGFNTTFWQLIESGRLYDVLGQGSRERKHLSEIEPPFVHIERELATHAPYAQWDDEYLHERQQSSIDFFGQYLGNWEALRAAYREGVEEVAENFAARLSLLEERGLLDDTLIIFTSDHGELLGEYGEWSHSTPLVPELVEVPTVVIHPEDRDAKSELVSHVDVLPTVADVLDFDIPWPISGLSIYSNQSRSLAYSQYLKPKNATATSKTVPSHRRYEYLVSGVWDTGGGWVFNQSGLSDRLRHLPIAAHRLLWPPRPFDFGRAPAGFYHHSWKVRRFGNPHISKDDAREQIADQRNRSSPTAIRSEISNEQRDQLRQLGYF